MITNTLQKRIHSGDREAFRAVYSEYGRGVFLAARKVLGTDADARNVVKQTFLNLHRELLNAADDVDIPVRIRELTDHELLLTKIVRNKGAFEAGAQSGVTSPVFANDASDPEQSSARSAFDGEDSAAAISSLPPLERTRAYMEADRTFDAEQPAKPTAEPEKKRRRGGFFRFLLFLLLLILLWALIGVLMDIRLIPLYDLGYRWFNETIYPLFSLFL